MKVTFYGGTGAVTGANFLIEHSTATGDTLRVLIDCGVLQGVATADTFNKEPFPYNPATIDFLFVTHAHMDHIGRIPKLVHEGFKGRIISTPPTKDMAEILFDDAVGIMDMEARKTGTLPIYDKQDVEKTLPLWETFSYHHPFDTGKGLTIEALDSGHILGSAMFKISDGKTTAIFTGDLGNSPSLLLPDTESPAGANYIIMESVYGDRNHEPKEERERKFKEALQNTIQGKRLLIIPAFSVERTQMLLYDMNRLFELHQLPKIPVFLDSPLAIKITKVYEKYKSYFNDNVRDAMMADGDVFSFPGLKLTPFSTELEKIDRTANPKIIIAGSGMSNGGRVVHHEHDHAGDKSATILLVGYQAVGTLGRQLEDGAKSVEINGKHIDVHATVEMIEGYSSHKDSDHLVAFVGQAAETGKLKKVFPVMGEPKSSMFLAQRLHAELDVNAEYPEYGETVELN